MTNSFVRPLQLLLASSIVSGCALLPGLNLGIDGQKNVSRYQPPSQDGNLVANFEPIVRRITPQLVLEQEIEQRESIRGNGLLAQLVKTGNDGAYPYKIGAGDSLGIIVYGQPELTNPTGTTQSPESTGRVVDASGYIYFPYVGDVKVAGKTSREVREIVRKKLSKYYREPQVDVRVVEYRSKVVEIVGDIGQPCLIPITELGLTITQALSQCATLSPEQIGGPQTLSASRSVRLDRSGEIIKLDLLDQAGGSGSIQLSAGDRLIVDSRFNRVFLLGEFEQQAVLPMSAGGLTLTDAIVAGAPSIETIDSSEIYVIRGFEGSTRDATTLAVNQRPHIFHLNADYASALVLADQFELKPRDVVYAAPASLVNFNRALAQITPLVNTLFQTALIIDRTSDR